MVKPFPSKTHIGNHTLHPETLMLNYGYDPQLSEGAVKPPVFLTATFVFRTAEDGKDFSISSRVGASLPRGWAQAWFILDSIIPTARSLRTGFLSTSTRRVARCSHPAWLRSQPRFSRFVRPGDVILHSQPLYGGTETLFAKTLSGLSIGAVGFADGIDESTVRRAADDTMHGGRVAIFSSKPPQIPSTAWSTSRWSAAWLRRSARPRGTCLSSRATIHCSGLCFSGRSNTVPMARCTR